ncbi:hypothetical protein B4096_2120 [Heyndrickxia coagulans]|nr:hypothetical protein B4096_2120 [Heyndrickxia coagulans]
MPHLSHSFKYSELKNHCFCFIFRTSTISAKCRFLRVSTLISAPSFVMFKYYINFKIKSTFNFI